MSSVILFIVFIFLLIISIYLYFFLKKRAKLKANRKYGIRLEKESILLFIEEAKKINFFYSIDTNVMMKTKEDIDILISFNGRPQVCIDIKSQWGLYVLDKGSNDIVLCNKNGKKIEKDYVAQVKRQKSQTCSNIGVLWCPNAKKENIIPISDNIFIVNGSVFLMLKFLTDSI